MNSTNPVHTVRMNAACTAMTSYEINDENQEVIDLTYEIWIGKDETSTVVSTQSDDLQHQIAVTACKTAEICLQVLRGLPENTICFVGNTQLEFEDAKALLKNTALLHDQRQHFNLEPVELQVISESDMDGENVRGSADSSNGSEKSGYNFSYSAMAMLVTFIAGIVLSAAVHAIRR